MEVKEVKMSELPEDTVDGVKLYGTTSYETQVAILSHYLHRLDDKHDIASGEKRYEILGAIRDYIEFKRKQDKKNPKFTFIDLLRGWAVFVWACRRRVANAFFPLSGMRIRKRPISRTLVRCHLATSRKN